MKSIYILANIKYDISKNVKGGESMEGVMDSKKIEVLNVKWIFQCGGAMLSNNEIHM